MLVRVKVVRKYERYGPTGQDGALQRPVSHIAQVALNRAESLMRLPIDRRPQKKGDELVTSRAGFADAIALPLICEFAPTSSSTSANCQLRSTRPCIIGSSTHSGTRLSHTNIDILSKLIFISRACANGEW